MYLIFHEDAYGDEYGEPVTFDTLEQVTDYQAARVDRKLPDGHAIILYECRYVRVLRGG